MSPGPAYLTLSWTSTSSSASTRAASLPDIKRAYRRLARRYHPDINPGDRDGRGALPGDPAGVRDAERSGPAAALRRSSASQTERGRRPGVRVRGVRLLGRRARGRSVDVRRSVRRRAAARARTRAAPAGARRRPARDASTLDVRGGGRAASSAPVTVTRQDALRARAGARHARRPEAPSARSARAPASLRSARGHMVFSKPCPRCGGSGRASAVQRCAPCARAPASRRATETVPVRLPAGRRRRRAAAVAGTGHAGRARRRARRPLRDRARAAAPACSGARATTCTSCVPVAVHEAALGARVDVPTLDGPARLRVPPGTQSGQRFRLRGRGAPSARDGRARRPGRRGAAGAAAGARRAVEGAAAGVRPDQRRRSVRR